MKALLDTHVLLRWFQERSRLPAAHKRVIARADRSRPLLVSEISLWVMEGRRAERP